MSDNAPVEVNESVMNVALALARFEHAVRDHERKRGLDAHTKYEEAKDNLCRVIAQVTGGK